jgi:VCBS repeat protein
MRPVWTVVFPRSLCRHRQAGRARLPLRRRPRGLMLEHLEGRALPSFIGAPVNYVVGATPQAVVQGDFTADGIPDLVTANNDNPGTVSVLLGNGDGSFQAARTLRVALYPQAVAVGDFNGDGNLDIVTANAASYGSVSILLGNGDGTFQPARTFTVGSYLSSVAVADFNRDGKPDLVVTDLGDYPFVPSGVEVLLGNGDGTFQPPHHYDAGVSPVSVVTGDFNGDQVPDIAVADKGTSSTTGNVSVLLGNGDGSFQRARAFATDHNPVAIVAADFNRDGRTDLATANGYFNGSVSVLLGNGDGSFRAPLNTPVSFIPSDLAAGDLTGDGIPDLLVTISDTATTIVLLGTGTGTFRTGMSVPVGQEPLAVAVGDWNGDGRPDLAVANQISGDVSVRLGNGDGTFATTPTFGPGGPVATADFNGDGIPDLVTAYGSGNGSLSVFLGNGDGTFQAPINSPYPSGANAIAVGDFNGDGKPDIVTASFSNHSVSVALGNGDGTFQAARTYALGSAALGLAVGDVNGDGNLDFAVGSNVISVFLGNGDGTFQAPINYNASGGNSLAVGDFNGDGIPDLATNYGLVLLGNGDGTFRNGGTYAVGDGPQAVVVGDFNGDGISDLAVSDEGFGRGDAGVSVLLGNGDGTFQAPRLSAAGRVSVGVLAGDFNNDGILDLAVAGPASEVSVLLGNGDGSFQSPSTTYALGPGVIGVGVAADFNGDGYLDLASSGITVLLNAADWPADGAPGSQPAPYRREVVRAVAMTPALATGEVSAHPATPLRVEESPNPAMASSLSSAGDGSTEGPPARPANVGPATPLAAGETERKGSVEVDPFLPGGEVAPWLLWDGSLVPLLFPRAVRTA